MQCGLGILVGQRDWTTTADDIKRTVLPDCVTCFTNSLHSHTSLVVFVATTSLKVE